MEIHEITNFLPSHICDLIIGEIPHTPTLPDKDALPFYKGRVRLLKHFPSRSVLEDVRDKMLNKARELFRKNIDVEHVDVVTWYDGQHMNPHCDVLDVITGQPFENCEERIYTGVLYLNDDYEGGETFFPYLDVKIKPEKGKLLLFPSNIGYIHGVNKVSGKTRYTMPIWFKNM